MSIAQVPFWQQAEASWTTLRFSICYAGPGGTSDSLLLFSCKPRLRSAYVKDALFAAPAAFAAHANKGGVLQGDLVTPLFDRESEQQLLQKRLMAKPENILLILGPRSSGKTCLLQEVIFGLDAPVSWISGRSQQLSDGRIMSQVLAADLKVQENALSQFNQGVSYKAQRLAGMLSASKISLGSGLLELQLPPAKAVSIHELIQAYKKNLVDQRDASGSWPVICIDEVNVLMEWVTGGPAMERDLDALLRFFVQVSCQALAVLCVCVLIKLAAS